MKRVLPVLLLASIVPSAGCFRGGGFLLDTAFKAAVITAVVVSLTAPPPPRVVIVPAPREGYVWQPGYWTKQGDEWVWVEGQFLPVQPGAQWTPTHWEEAPDGSWRLVPGQWTQAPPPPG
jgi:hypothetical protein